MQTAAKRRPFLVWFIVIATGVGFLFFVLFVYVVARQWASIPEEGKKAFQTLSTLTWIAAAIGTVTTVLGTVQLFRMKKGAFYLYSAGMGLGLLDTLRSYLAGTLPDGPWAGSIIGIGLQFLVLWYVWCLYRKQMLD